MSIISSDSVVLKQLKNFKRMDLNKLGNAAVKMNEKELITLQQDQMRMGKNSEGFNPNYSPYTLGLKLQSDTYFAPPPKMDFYDTGDFQNAMYMEKDGGFNSKDSKTKELTTAYGDKILDPNNETKEVGQSITTPDYYKLVHKAINK